MSGQRPMRMRTAALLVFVSVLVAACGTADSDSAGVPNDSQPAPTTIEPLSPSAPSSQGSGAALAVSDGVKRAMVDPNAPVDELAAGWNDAGFDLLRRLPSGDNLVFSPASIGHALLMAAAAGDDATRSAIETAFGLPDGAHEAWNSLDHAIAATHSEPVTVAVADRIWPRVDVEPDQEWVDLLAAQHGADVVPLDYTNEPEASREVINGWVSDRTDGLIPDLLPRNFIKPGQTVLVLTDTLYFAADWAIPFGKYGPVDGTFTTLDGTQVEASFMRELELDDRPASGTRTSIE